MSFQSTQEFMAALRSLIDSWCEHRRFKHLAAVLPGYVAFNGLTDGWFELLDSLRNAVALGAAGLPENEWEMLQRLCKDAAKAVDRS